VLDGSLIRSSKRAGSTDVLPCVLLSGALALLGVVLSHSIVPPCAYVEPVPKAGNSVPLRRAVFSFLSRMVKMAKVGQKSTLYFSMAAPVI
jgi:hypothetical protein